MWTKRIGNATTRTQLVHEMSRARVRARSAMAVRAEGEGAVRSVTIGRRPATAPPGPRSTLSRDVLTPAPAAVGDGCVDLRRGPVRDPGDDRRRTSARPRGVRRLRDRPCGGRLLPDPRRPDG